MPTNSSNRVNAKDGKIVRNDEMNAVMQRSGEVMEAWRDLSWVDGEKDSREACRARSLVLLKPSGSGAR